MSVVIVTPKTGTSSGGTAVAIGGTGFVPGSKVYFGDVPAEAKTVEARLITATTPPRDSGTADVRVVNPDGQSVVLPGAFTYVNPLLTISNMVERVGTTQGGAGFVITGTGFLDGARVGFGGVEVSTSHFRDSLAGITPPHTAGVVDVTVTNPGGDSTTLAGGYTYVDPGTFDANGKWIADDFPLVFTIQNNQLIALSCGRNFDITFSPEFAPLPVINGAVALTESFGSFSARMLSSTASLGTVNIPSCLSGQWRAYK